MTKKEKKAIIAKLITEVEQATDMNDYAAKRSQLFHEVIGAGYPERNIEGTTLAADTWCKDFDRNMEAKLANQPLPNDKLFMAMSAKGLLTLIDTSLLPDE